MSLDGPSRLRDVPLAIGLSAKYTRVYGNDLRFSEGTRPAAQAERVGSRHLHRSYLVRAPPRRG